LEGRAEAHLIALGPAPKLHEGTIARVFEASLADKAVELGIVEKVSHETVPKPLKKPNSSLT
jgi:hypothetical protein